MASTAKGTETGDRYTHLTRLLDGDLTYRTWSQAETYCQSLGNGCRLPAYKEVADNH